MTEVAANIRTVQSAGREDDEMRSHDIMTEDIRTRETRRRRIALPWRILRSFIGVIDATLRTSYYLNTLDRPRADGGPRDYVSYKLDPALVPDLPKPRP